MSIGGGCPPFAPALGNTIWQVVDRAALFSLHHMFIYENLIQLN